jgi:hypothetical protein
MRITALLVACFAMFVIEFCRGASQLSPRPSLSLPVVKDSIEQAKAERHLYLGEVSLRKARNSLISSFLTLGLLYIVSLYWIGVALYHSIKAYNYYSSNTEVNQEDLEEAKKIFYRTSSLAILHLFLIMGIILLGTGTFSALQSSTLIGPKNLALLVLLLFLLCDLLFFKIFFKP